LCYDGCPPTETVVLPVGFRLQTVRGGRYVVTRGVVRGNGHDAFPSAVRQMASTSGEVDY
jgi:hypothetical protein